LTLGLSRTTLSLDRIANRVDSQIHNVCTVYRLRTLRMWLSTRSAMRGGWAG